MEEEKKEKEEIKQEKITKQYKPRNLQEVTIALGSTTLIFILFITIVPKNSYLYSLIFSASKNVSTSVLLGQAFIPLLIIFILILAIATLRSKSKWVNKEYRTIEDFYMIKNNIENNKENSEYLKEILQDLSMLDYEGFVYNRLKKNIRKSITTKPKTVYKDFKERLKIDMDECALTYEIIRQYIWVMPILGFVGTVIGISSSIGNFSSFLTMTGDNIPVALIKNQLSFVTNGLSFAFNTTLLGLLGSVIVVFLNHFIQNKESRLITELEKIIYNLCDFVEGGIINDEQ